MTDAPATFRTRQFEWPSADTCDPIEVRPTDDREVVRGPLDARDVLSIALFALTGDDAAADVFDAILATTTPEVTRSLPVAAGSAIVQRVDDRHRAAVHAAVDVVLQRFSRTDGSPAWIEAAVQHVAAAVLAAITGSMRAELGVVVDADGHPDPDPIWTEAAASAATEAVDIVAARLHADLLTIAGATHE